MEAPKRVPNYKHPLYCRWRNIRDRCNRKNHTHYKYYGGRGIKRCARWNVFKNFLEDMEATWKPGLTLDRIDNDKGYFKENCRWVTLAENNANKRVTHSSREFCKHGHKYTEDPSYWDNRIKHCRVCKKEREARVRAIKKAARDFKKESECNLKQEFLLKKNSTEKQLRKKSNS